MERYLLAPAEPCQASPISLRDLEAWVHWSGGTLHDAFRDACGCSPMRWVRRRRLHHAMRRLQNPLPGDTVRLMAQSVGFSSIAPFSWAFQQQHGGSPASVFRG